MVRYETWLIVGMAALVLYLFATKDNPYINIRDRDQPIKSRLGVINWHSWLGPLFIEDFKGNVKNCPTNISEPSVPPGPLDWINNPPTGQRKNCPYPPTGGDAQLYNPKRELVPTNTSCTVPKYNNANPTAKKCHAFAKKNCRVPELDSSQWWKQEYHTCTYRMRGPNFKTGDMGNFRQCTNNTLNAPNNLRCQCFGRQCETCPPNERLSQGCYADLFDGCMKNLQT